MPSYFGTTPNGKLVGRISAGPTRTYASGLVNVGGSRALAARSHGFPVLLPSIFRISFALTDIAGSE